MYIAFKWLAGLVLAMWISMCIIDGYIKNKKVISKKDGIVLETPYGAEPPPYTNASRLPNNVPTVHITNRHPHQYKQYDTTALHYIMFFAGVISVSLFNKKNEIISYTKNHIAKIDVKGIIIVTNNILKEVSVIIFDLMKKYSTIIWINIRIYISQMQNKRRGLRRDKIENNQILNSLLIKKIKEYVEEQKRLGQLLIAAVRENKNIRLQYQLETMAKNRLVRHIEDTQKKVKENRSRYINYQHLYLVTHQENVFLKARVRKLTKDKEDIEKNLMAIINQVYKSRNNELKAYCARFIVRPNENIMDSDISAEVRKFLEKSRRSVTSNRSECDNSDMKDALKTMDAVGSVSDTSLVPLVLDAPKLKGLPGEYIWTVKDKDGIIEKLYEYDMESDFDNGDTIRRIRQYSVYHDKDCLLDFSSSRRVEKESMSPVNLRLYPANERFLTGSEAFQKFLQNNTSVIPSSRSANTRSLLCV